jgi:hypothetical protein
LCLILPLLIEIYYSFLTREQGVYTFHIVQKFTLDNYIQVFTQKYIVESLLFTIGISFVIAVGTVVLGIPVAQFWRGGPVAARSSSRCACCCRCSATSSRLRVALRVRTAGHRELVPDGDRVDPRTAPPREPADRRGDRDDVAESVRGC